MDVLHPQRELHQPEQRSPAIADDQKQSSPPPQSPTSTCQSTEHHEKVKLREINPYLTCHLCEGYLIDATTISECLHSFCRSCIIKFLEDNSFCPVCEVIINKAKPNLKLDKTLQDIVYKLVPGLFLAEMLRRKRFYAERPGRAAGVSPEQRGEDTERTIFNPQDRISLALEYIGDAATSGIILKDLRTALEQQQAEMDADSKKSATRCDDAQAETLLKRYLQCPGMCRIDVIKKFIRNKYNVNTDMFQIDILYKRVPLPLPDHYTLIDVAYIYTWKRNEPMRFYFRIIDKGNDELPDLTKVFTPIDAPPLLRPQARSTPLKKIPRTPSIPDRKKRTPKKNARKVPASPKLIKKEDCKNCDRDTIECESNGDVKVEVCAEISAARLEGPENSNEGLNSRIEDYDDRRTVKNEIKREGGDGVDVELTSGEIKTEKDCNLRLNDDSDTNEQIYTNITLNRSNNVEIITKIHKVSSKDGQPCGMNIINQTVKKTNKTNLENKVQNPSTLVPENVESKIEIKQEMPVLEPEVPVIERECPTSEGKSPVLKQEVKEPETNAFNSVVGLTEKELEQKKFEFLKSIELTSKETVDNLAKQQAKALLNTSHISVNKGNISSTSSKPFYSIKPPVPNAAMEILKTKRNIVPKPGTNGVKRKNSSPMKNESKKLKVEHKRTTKIILQQKPGFPAINPLKQTEIVPKSHDNTVNQSKDLHSLFQNCRLNIPSSLSITLKENGETSRKPLLMPPVQNYIEILKIDEKEGRKTITLKREDSISSKNYISENNELAEMPLPSSAIGVTCSFSNDSNSPRVSSNQEPKITPVAPKASSFSPTESSIKFKESKDVSTKIQQQQSFQKIFEESIKKSEGDSVAPEGGTDPSNSSGKRNILEIAQQLYKKTKTEQDNQTNSLNSFADSQALPRCATPLSIPTVPKIAIPRLNNQRVVKPPKRSQKYESLSHQAVTNLHSGSFSLPHQTLTNLHSSSLGLNYTVSVSKQSKDLVQQTYRVNGVMSPQGANLRNVKNGETNAKSPKNRSKVEQTSTAMKSTFASESVTVKSSPSPPKTVDQKIPSGQFSPKVSKVPNSPRPIIAQPSKAEPGLLNSPKNLSPRNYSTKISQSSPKSRSRNISPKLAQSASSSSVTSTSSSALTPNELLEKYNIQNLAQLSASINFNAAAAPQNYLNAVQGTQMAALHQAMLLKQFELQNRQKWLNINQGPLLQFEKYLQSLNASKNQILGNLKDN